MFQGLTGKTYGQIPGNMILYGKKHMGNTWNIDGNIMFHGILWNTCMS
jgi:hypothetical protein